MGVHWGWGGCTYLQDMACFTIKICISCVDKCAISQFLHFILYVGFQAFCCASIGVPMCVCDLWINQVWLVM